jgi:GTP-binding protein HflX
MAAGTGTPGRRCPAKPQTANATARRFFPILSSIPTAAQGAENGAPRAVLVGVDLGGAAAFDPTLDELAQLAVSAGDAPVARLTARRRAPDATLFVGAGKADELKALVAQSGADGVIFDQALSPAQQRNLERHLGVPVSDRTALIIDIFGDRARSHEGKLQVELARLQYLATRLVRRWSHLERQRGGIGNRGGPGEAQIELDRRMIGTRIKQVKERLERVKRQRGTQRRARERSGSLRVSLVGYTNAGKSTLFNALVKARSFAADQLFATLDTTTRSLWLEGADRSVVLSDTVGFIRDLPHKLIEAFEATLQEAADADLLLLARADGLHLVGPDRCALVDQPAFDGSRRLATVEARTASTGSRPYHPAALTRLADRAAVLTAATLLGIGAHLVEVSVAYVAQRHQFGRPVGSFQAIKHRLADAHLAVEFARPLTWVAAHQVGELAPGDPEASTAAAAAKVAAAAAEAAANTHALQCHGGIGFTWEHDLHLWLKRGKALESAYGTPARHRARIADDLFGPGRKR